jgi:hypothetical protein
MVSSVVVRGEGTSPKTGLTRGVPDDEVEETGLLLER